MGVHPYNQRKDLERLVRSEGIRFEAYSPLGKGVIGLFEDQVLKSIANANNKSVAAVILRWLLQRGITPIPLSRNKNRIEENLNVFDFTLSEVEMQAIAKLDRGQFVLMDDEKLAWSYPCAIYSFTIEISTDVVKKSLYNMYP